LHFNCLTNPMFSRLTSKALSRRVLPNRGFATMTRECEEHLRSLGITNANVVFNPSVGELYEYALKPEHIRSPD